MKALFAYLFPRQTTVGHRERLFSGLAGFAAILLASWLCHRLLGDDIAPFIVASMGASAVLLLGVPHSPFSQPWSFVGGQMISALIGVTCAQWIPDMYLAAGLAVGLSLAAMYYLRCLHPPGGATTLLIAVGGERIHAMGYRFLLTPMLVNVAILLTLALLINRLVPGRRYPVSLSLPGKNEPATVRPAVKLGFSEDDLLAALRDMGGYIDVTGEDLERIYALATLHRHQRRLGDIRLADIMTREVVTVGADTSLEALWQTLRQHGIRGVPVADAQRRVVGMATVVDFLKDADWRQCGLRGWLRSLLRRSAAPTVAQIMSTPVISAPADMSMPEAFLLFADKRINHLPVVDGEGRLAGIVTRLDLLAAIYGDLATAG